MERIRFWGRLFSFFCVPALLFNTYPAGLRASEQSQHHVGPADPNTGQESIFWSTLRTDIKNWPGRIINDSNDIFFSPSNLTALLLAGGASIAMHNSGSDRHLADHVFDNRVFHGFIDESINVIGGPGPHFAATTLWYVISVKAGDDLNKQRSWTMMTALAITGLTTAGLKAIRDNRNPNGNRYAWPSGHTSSSFTVASMLDEFYGPKIGIPAYLGAGLVAYRMMDTGDHWASDVLFGSVLGWVVGHTVAGKHKKLEIAGFDVLPYTDSTALGITFVRQF
ncbi:MAG: phosphatase PAP2 family protein [Planctomycetota bacterium]